jgi:L,D-peptidoglycan transpeptidase YkuD (ErfK/YbiS/YcfS/YnhG family)
MQQKYAQEMRKKKQMHKRTLSRLIVRRRAGNSRQGWLTVGPFALPVALGRGGIKANKREGDGGTPRGAFRLKRLWWRAERQTRPPTLLPSRRIRQDDAWCEDPADRHYNQPVKLAPDSNADRLARTDDLYDFIIELDHNTRPRVKGRGSAVFIHAARAGFAPTAGCVALNLATLRRLLARVGPRTKIVIE